MNRYHIILAKDNNGDIAGGGIGTQIYKYILNIMEIDAHRINNKKLDYVFCEIDSPAYCKSGNNKYLYFWNKNNYFHLDFNYVQPALSVSQSPVHGLWLVISSQQATDLTEVKGQLVADVIYDYLKYAMQIENPEQNPDFIKMKEELSKPIKLQRIVQ